MEHSTIRQLESELGVSVEYDEGYAGGYDSCTVKVPWKAMNMFGLVDPKPGATKLARVERALARHGFALNSVNTQRGFMNAYAGSNTVMVFLRMHR